MKSYTDIEQSKKLAEILPIESADMCFNTYNNNMPPLMIPYNRFNEYFNMEPAPTFLIPCWSLASLLDIMICPNLEEYIEGIWDLTTFTDNTLKTPIEIQDCKDPVDACVTMIEKLHELKML